MSEEIKPVEGEKHFLKSKTFWVNVMAVLGIVLAQYYPAGAEFIQANFSEIGGAWAVINVLLRMVSKDKLFLS